MKSFSVIRTHSSPYHGLNFEQNERDRLEKIPGIIFTRIDRPESIGPNILITNTHTRLGQIRPAVLKETKLIVHSNSGYDHFAQDYHLWKDIPVIIGHQIRAQAVAEYCLSSLFTALLELPQHLSWKKDRNWDRPLIKDQEVWIFGHGHIGRIVSSTLKTIGAKVTVVDPFVAGHLSSWKNGQLSKARIVIACCSLNSTSRYLFDESFFHNAHPELIFINGARGQLVKENALREFLLSHPRAQAFLDVFEREPFDESWHHFPQVWKTSHIAGVYSDLDEAIIEFEEKTLKEFMELDENAFRMKYHQELLQNKWIKGELV